MNRPQTADMVTTRRVRRLAASFAGVTLAGIGLTVDTAQAEQLDNGEYTDYYTDDFQECGFSIHLDGTASGQWSLRVGSGSQVGLFPQHNNFEFTEVLTNTENGRFLTVEGNGNFVQLAATNIEGTVWEGSLVVTLTVRIIDDSGHVVITEAGQEFITEMFDDGGDGQPGTTPIGEAEVRTVGHHPLAEFTPEQWCESMASLLG
jgi:hypothetical protein